MRNPLQDRDYALISVYRCMVCHNFTANITDTMQKHIREEHPEALNQD